VVVLGVRHHELNKHRLSTVADKGDDAVFIAPNVEDGDLKTALAEKVGAGVSGAEFVEVLVTRLLHVPEPLT